MSDIDVNTVSSEPTHFLAAVELIKAARAQYGIPSENWPSPTSYRYGFAKDRYYAEVWIDGMDWQSTYWIIEAENFNRPKVFPLILFDNDEQRKRFNDYDFRELLMAMMHYRRDNVWIKSGDGSVFDDQVWPYIERLFPIHEERLKKWGCDRFFMEHASQKPAPFFGNFMFIPDRCKTPYRIFTNLSRFFRLVCSHPYAVELFSTRRKKHNVIEAHGSVAPTVDYIGFRCKKTGSKWIISIEDAKKGKNSITESKDFIHAFELSNEKSEEKILSFVNKNVVE